MKMACISIIEVSKKQDYIFNSNKLKDNIGASLIIRYISEQLAYEKKWLTINDRANQCSSYALMEGGGQAVYVFPSLAEAVEFNKNITSHVLIDYPGIELVCSTYNFDNETTLITEALGEAFKAMANKKSARSHVAMQFSYGLNEICTRTGMPAVKKHDGETVSEEIVVKRAMTARDQKDVFTQLIPEGYQFPTDIDQLVESDSGKSYVAVVHIDGNQMGKKLTAFRGYYQKGSAESFLEFNERYRSTFCTFSNEVDACYKRAFARMTKQLEEKYRNDDKVSLFKDKTNYPLRPLIVAGDDISFVTNGQIGIEAARIFLEQLQLEVVNVGEQYMTMHACAGIALVKKGYPFARAHQLAEQLCKNAKTRILEDNQEAGVTEEDSYDFSALDFHIVSGETDESLRALRQSQYSVSQNVSLCMKPYYVLLPKEGQVFINSRELADELKVKQLPHQAREHLKNIMNEGIAKINPFPAITLFGKALARVRSEKVGRNKIKQWRAVYHKTADEQRFFIGQQQMEKILKEMVGEGVPAGALHMTKGDKTTAIYYDAIEMMDVTS